MSFELILPFLRPIEPLLLDESISEIMGNPDASWWYERDGIMLQEESISFDAGKLQTGLEVIANQLGKKLDEDNPLLHAQLPDGSRLAAVIPPVVRCTPALIIRKFTSRHYTVDDLIARGTLTRALAMLAPLPSIVSRRHHLPLQVGVTEGAQGSPVEEGHDA